MSGGDRGSEIIGAAWRLFTEYGFKATTIDQIAREASMGKGTFYNYFATKEDVLYAIVDQAGQGMKKISDEFIDESALSEASALAAELPMLVRKFLSMIVGWRADFGLYRDLVREAKAFGSPKVAEAVARLDRCFERELSRVFSSLVDRSVILPCDCDLVAFVAIEVYSALIERKDKRGRPMSSEKIAGVMVPAIVGGLVNPVLPRGGVSQ